MDNQTQNTRKVQKNGSRYGDLKNIGSVNESQIVEQEFIVRKITSEDWQAYRDFYKDLKLTESETPHMFNGLLDGAISMRKKHIKIFSATLSIGNQKVHS